MKLCRLCVGWTCGYVSPPGRQARNDDRSIGGEGCGGCRVVARSACMGDERCRPARRTSFSSPAGTCMGEWGVLSAGYEARREWSEARRARQVVCGDTAARRVRGCCRAHASATRSQIRCEARTGRMARLGSPSTIDRSTRGGGEDATYRIPGSASWGSCGAWFRRRIGRLSAGVDSRRRSCFSDGGIQTRGSAPGCRVAGCDHRNPSRVGVPVLSATALWTAGQRSGPGAVTSR